MTTGALPKKQWLIGLLTLLMVATGTQAANQHWDSSTDPGNQHGDGTWSTSDSQWTTNGTSALAAWTQNNRASFNATGGTSVVTVKSAIQMGTMNFG